MILQSRSRNTAHSGIMLHRVKYNFLYSCIAYCLHDHNHMSDVFLRVTQVVINVNIIGVRLLSSSHLKKAPDYR